MTFDDTVQAGIVAGGALLLATGKWKIGLALIFAGLIVHTLQSSSATGTTTP